MSQKHQLPLFDKGKLLIADVYDPSADVTLYQGDCLDLLEDIRKSGDKAHLIVTSPPYNVGKAYEESISFNDYVEQQRQTIERSVEVLAEDGSICWQVGHYIEGSGNSKEAFPLDIVLYPIFKSFGLKLKNRIVWTFGHGLHEKTRFSGRHETILWFVKSDNYVFNLDPVRIPQKYPGKRAYQGENKGKPSGNPAGKNPSDIWDIPNVKSNHREKTEHPCQFPLGLVERLILALTNENDLVIDPYLGVGSTAAAAIMRGRRAAGADIVERYLEIARERVQQAYDGTLPYRQMNKPIHIPNANNRVSTIPIEWMQNNNTE